MATGAAINSMWIPGCRGAARQTAAWAAALKLRQQRPKTVTPNGAVTRRRARTS